MGRPALSATAALAAAAVVVGLADDAGYSAGPRVVFGVLALLAGGAAVVADRAAAARAARAPLVVVLLALAALGAASAAWTIGSAGDALRWGLVTAGLAALVVASAVVVRERAWLAGGLAAVAVAIALVGLVAAAEATTPLAHREAGAWRPGSTFQYGPALALLMVGALPTLLRAMCRGRRALAAAFGGAVAGAVLSLAVSRVELGLGIAVALAALAWPRRTLGASRTAAAAAVALVTAAGLGAYAVDGGYVVVTPPPDGTRRLVELLGVLALCTAAWPLARALLARGGRRALAAVAVLALAGPVAALAKPPARLLASALAVPGRPHPHRHADPFLHGRPRIWRIAWHAFEDRPLHGAGADAFYAATAARQGDRPTFYAHDLPLELAAELGIGGLLLALALYAAAAPVLWRGRDAWLLAVPAAAFLAANLVDWPWHFAGSGAVWAVAIGALLRPGSRVLAS